MKTENWITIASALIVALGWFVTGYLTRKKDVAQRRLEYRMKALEAFLPVWFTIQRNSAPFSQPGFLALVEDARSKFQPMVGCLLARSSSLGRLYAQTTETRSRLANSKRPSVKE